MSKTAYLDGLALVDQGIMTPEQLAEGISAGLIASERVKGGRPRIFVSEAQKQFYEDKQIALEAAKKAVEKVTENFMQTYGADWSDDGKLGFSVRLKGFNKAFNSFQPE